MRCASRRLGRRWAVVLVTAAAWTSGCAIQHTQSAAPTISNTAASGAVDGRPSLGMPIAVPGHTTCVVPFALESRKGWFDDRDPFTRGGYADARYGPSTPAAAGVWSVGSGVRWHNAIVRDMSSGEEWTILQQRGVISRYDAFMSRPDPEKQPVCLGMVFIATLEDTSGEGLLDDRDASVAVVTAGDGRSPRIVTPAAAQVWSTAYDARTGRVYLYVVADSDGDGKFTPNDAPVPYVYDPSGDGRAVPLISGEVAGRVERLLK